MSASNNIRPLITFAAKKGNIFVISVDIIRGDTVLGLRNEQLKTHVIVHGLRNPRRET